MVRVTLLEVERALDVAKMRRKAKQKGIRRIIGNRFVCTI